MKLNSIFACRLVLVVASACSHVGFSQGTSLTPPKMPGGSAPTQTLAPPSFRKQTYQCDQLTAKKGSMVTVNGLNCFHTFNVVKGTIASCFCNVSAPGKSCPQAFTNGTPDPSFPSQSMCQPGTSVKLVLTGQESTFYQEPWQNGISPTEQFRACKDQAQAWCQHQCQDQAKADSNPPQIRCLVPN